MQVEAFKRLTDAGVKQEVILEILKDKSNVWAIGSADATVNIKDKFGDLIVKTKEYYDLLKLIENQTKTFEQKTQESIDLNVSALDLQARTLQNAFDVENFNLKAKIKTAELDIKSVNDSIQKEQDKIDAINLTLKYDPNIGQNLLDDLQEQVSDAQRDIEIDFQRPIERLQEEINDAQRKIDIDFERPLQALSDRSSILSNDLTLIDKSAEAINEKYDKQEEALKTISELNQDIAAQEQKRISLADALSQGDISAAAQMANEMRSTAAEAASRRSGDLIAAARKAETEALRSASGMTRVQIEAEQFRIGQQTFVLEQQRKIAQEAILKIEDQIFTLEKQSKIAKEAVVAIEDRIYNIAELRELKLLEIRNIETTIDGIKATQLAKAQEALDKLQAELDKNQEILDAKLAGIEKEKLAWDSVQLKLDAYKLALEQSKNELVSMLELVNAIASAMSQLSSMNLLSTSAYTSSSANNSDSYVPPEDTPESEAALEEFLRIVAELDAALAAVEAGANNDAEYDRLQQRLAAAQKAYDDYVNAGFANGINPADAAANAEAAALAAEAATAAADAAVAMADATAEAADAAVAEYDAAVGAGLASGVIDNLAKMAAAAAQAAQDAADAILVTADRAAKAAADAESAAATAASAGSVSGGGGMVSYMLASSGGMVPKYLASGGMVKPKYFAVGGKARGTDIIPAMLTPGEFVMSKYAVNSYGVDKMKAINNGSYEGGKVYNYNLNVNVKSDANPEDIARVVMTQIRQVDSQRIRTQRG
jgi:hypothetical protein